MPANNITTVLNRMRKKGLTLHSEHNNRRQRVVWTLSDGTEVTPKIAAELTRHPNVKSAGDVLPLGLGPPCQTYRLCL